LDLLLIAVYSTTISCAFFLVEQFRVLVLQQFRAIVHFLVSVRLKGGKRPKPHLTASLTQLCILIKKSTTVHP